MQSDYTVTTPFPHLGRTTEVGATVSLSEREAFYLHRQGKIALPADAIAAAPRKIGRGKKNS